MQKIIALLFAAIIMPQAVLAATATRNDAAGIATISLDIVDATAYSDLNGLTLEFSKLEGVKQDLRGAAKKYTNLFNYGQNALEQYNDPDKWYPIEIGTDATLYHHNMAAMLGACSLYYRSASTFDPKLPTLADTIEYQLKYLSTRKSDARKWASAMFGGALPNMGYDSYVNLFQQSECCPAGTYNYTNYGFDVGYCQVCERGWYCLGGSNRFQCPVDSQGFKNPSSMREGAIFKSECGFQPCKPGWYYDKNYELCWACPAGSYCEGGTPPDDAPKVLCPDGTTSDPYAQSVEDCYPTTCPAGQYLKKFGNDGKPLQTSEYECVPCAPGTYSDNVNDATQCDLCQAGTASNMGLGGLGSTGCDACGELEFSLVAADHCTFCGGEKQIWDPATGQCKECPAGAWPNAAHTECIIQICEPGEEPVPNTDGECKDCVGNTIKPQAGNQNCTACPPETPIANADHTACECCAGGEQIDIYDVNSEWTGGTYFDLAAGVCTACPANARCTGCKPFECNPGYILSADGKRCESCPNGYYNTGFGATECKKIPDTGSCVESGVGGEACTEIQCDPGFVACDPSKDENCMITGCLQNSSDNCLSDDIVCTLLPEFEMCEDVAPLLCAEGYMKFWIPPTLEDILGGNSFEYGKLGCKLINPPADLPICQNDGTHYHVPIGNNKYECQKKEDAYNNTNANGRSLFQGTYLRDRYTPYEPGVYYFVESGRADQGSGAGEPLDCNGSGYQPCFGNQVIGGAACIPCDEGSYSKAQDQHADLCNKCPFDWSTAAPGASTIVECSDRSQCGNCPEFPWNTGCLPGYFLADKGDTATCEPCPSGTYQPGQVGDDPRHWFTSCKPCPAGTINCSGGGFECPNGQQPNPVHGVCENAICTNGWGFDADETLMCKECRPGSFSAAADGTRKCFKCGTYGDYDKEWMFYQDLSEQNLCKPVPEYARANQAIEATGFVCNAGFNRSGDICVCPAGGFVNAAEQCAKCPENAVCNQQNQTQITQCATGFVPTSNGQGCEKLVCRADQDMVGNTCVCKPGFDTNANGTCTCPAGKYIAKGGSCDACPDGFYCPDANSSRQESCPTGKYCPIGSANYSDCPSGATGCAAGRILGCKPAYNGSSCVPGNISCRTDVGFSQNGDKCYCQAGRLINNGQCVACPAGAVCNGEDAETFQCNANGYSPVNGSCEFNCNSIATGGSEDCNGFGATYQYWYGGACKCVPSNATGTGTGFNCPSGFKADLAVGTCEVDDTLTCPAGIPQSMCNQATFGGSVQMQNGNCYCYAGNDGWSMTNSGLVCVSPAPAGATICGQGLPLLTCTAGQQPNTSTMTCDNCAPGTFSTDGSACKTCPTGATCTASSVSCPAGTNYNSSQNECVESGGAYECPVSISKSDCSAIGGMDWGNCACGWDKCIAIDSNSGQLSCADAGGNAQNDPSLCTRDTGGDIKLCAFQLPQI